MGPHVVVGRSPLRAVALASCHVLVSVCVFFGEASLSVLPLLSEGRVFPVELENVLCTLSGSWLSDVCSRSLAS